MEHTTKADLLETTSEVNDWGGNSASCHGHNGIFPNRLLACMRDRAAVNNVAVRFMKVLYTNLLDVGCFSHTLDLVGDKICVPTLSDFMLSWLSLFSHSTKAKLLWKKKTGRTIRSYCPTRWWSKWECMKQVFELFPVVDSFVKSNDEFSHTTRSKLIALLNDQDKKEVDSKGRISYNS